MKNEPDDGAIENNENCDHGCVSAFRGGVLVLVAASMIALLPSVLCGWVLFSEPALFGGRLVFYVFGFTFRFRCRARTEYGIRDLVVAISCG